MQTESNIYTIVAFALAALSFWALYSSLIKRMKYRWLKYFSQMNAPVIVALVLSGCAVQSMSGWELIIPFIIVPILIGIYTGINIIVSTLIYYKNSDGHLVKTVLSHLFLGFGFFFLDKSVKRKIVYPIFGILALIIYTLAMFRVHPMFNHEPAVFYIFMTSLFICYVVGTIDVVLYREKILDGRF